MEKILTVVIPSYNTEKYMDECLPFFLDDRILKDVEMLIINDGSKDNTSLTAEKYAKKFPDTVRLITKENGGHGSVINRGIEEASGKYFKVVDGDDWVVTENFAGLVEKLKHTDADLVMNPYIKYHIGRKTESLVEMPIHDYDTVKKFDVVAKDLNTLELHGITFKTSILKENNIKMQEKCYYEDSEYDLYPIPYIDTIVFYKEPVYVYRIGSPTQSVNMSNAVKNLDMHYTILKNMINFYSNLGSGISDEKRDYMIRFIVSRIQSQYGIYLKIKFGKDAKKGMLEFDSNLKQLSRELYDKSMTLPIRFIRSKSWICYFMAYMSFKVKRIKRGF